MTPDAGTPAARDGGSTGRPGTRTPDASTVDPGEWQTPSEARRGRIWRRAAITVLLVFVMAGLTNRLGYRQAHASVEHDGVRVELSHPAVSRGGLPSTWSVVVATVDGAPIGGRVSVVTTAAYFDVFDHNDLDPEPDAGWQTADAVTWEFDAVDRTELAVSLDVRTQPDARWRHRATTAVLVDDREVATFDYSTFVMP